MAMVFPFQSSFDHKFGLGEYLTKNRLFAPLTVNKGSTGFLRLQHSLHPPNRQMLRWRHGHSNPNSNKNSRRPQWCGGGETLTACFVLLLCSPRKVSSHRKVLLIRLLHVFEEGTSVEAPWPCASSSWCSSPLTCQSASDFFACFHRVVMSSLPVQMSTERGAPLGVWCDVHTQPMITSEATL